MPLQITEPHPTAHPNTYMHTGRGGAGNMLRVQSNSPAPFDTLSTRQISKIATNLTTNTTSSLHSSSKFSAGRGGAGNIRPASEAAPYSFDDEARTQLASEMGHAVWHVGRGGAGNWGTRREGGEGERKFSNESLDSNGSVKSGFMGRLSGVFERR